MDLEQLTHRREYTYSCTSLVLSILTFALHYSELTQLIAHITTEGEIPFHSFLGLVFCEVVKLGLVFYLFCPTPSKIALLHLKSVPFSGGTRVKTPATTRFGKILELGSMIWQAILCCVVCYIFVILFGAPLLSKFVLTAQFSTILTAWMFTPLCLVFSPRDILKEIVYFSTWNTKIGSISRAKLRLISTVAGGMGGVALIPLDWDRHWQVWPVPCLFSAFLTVTLVNFLFVLYFSYSYIQSCNFYVEKFTSATSSSSRSSSSGNFGLGSSSSSNNKTKNF